MTREIGKIVVYVTDSRTAPVTVETAGRLARRFGASLTGLHVVADTSIAALAPVPSASANQMLIEEMQEQAETRALNAQEAFSSVVSKNGWDGQWLCIDNPKFALNESIARTVHLADLVVAGQEYGDTAPEAERGIVTDMIIDGGRPVILNPQGWSGPVGKTKAVIAWKPSREAARAVYDALPILAEAEKVTVATVHSDEGSDARETAAGAALCRYLKTHGIAAQPKPVFGVAESDTGEALVDLAQRMGSDLLVLGAYSHSRLREGIFGGVTRDIIEKSKVPALLSH